MSGKSSNSLQVLVDCFDDIPNIMTKMNESINSSPTRYKATGRNSSFAVDGVLRGNKRVDISKRENTHRVERMATQALRVLDNLSKLPNQKRQTRPLTETAAIAQSKLKSLVDSGIDIHKFYQQYDVNRSGKVSYKDFCDTLGAVSSGLGREEAHELARQLDSRRVGLIEYNNILSSLQQIRKEAGYKEAANNQVHHNERRQPVQAWAEETQRPLQQEQEQHQRNHQHTANQEHAQLPQQQHQQQQYSQYTASDETKSEAPTHNNHTEQTNAPPKVSPRTSFEYIAPAGESNLSPNSSSNNNYYSRPGTPEAEALTSVPRRYLYNRDVNHVVYGEQVRHTPFDFDGHHYQQEQEHPHRAHRRRCSSVPARARKSNFCDSGCNVAPTAEAVHFDELAHFSPTMRTVSDSLKFSNGSLTVQVPNDPALTARLEANPFYLAREHQAQTLEERKQHAGKTVESAIVDQINGGVANLRHTLRSFDASKSGTLNNDELRGALKKAGVKLSNEQYGELYQELASTRTSSNTPGYSRGQVVSIDALAERLHAHTVATRPPPSTTTPVSSFEALYAMPRVYGDAANKAEKVRVMKKVLQSASKLTNPHAIYKHIDPQHNGYLNEPQLQDALLYMGANLSSKEFSVLVNNVPRDVDGRIEITQFERNLRDQVRQQEHKDDVQSGEIKQHFRRYSRTFKSSENFQLAQENHEFEPLCHKKGLLVPVENDKRWNQLKEVFQTHPEIVRNTFSVPKPASPQRKPLYNKNDHAAYMPVEIDESFTKSISVAELKQQLAQSGLPLSTDDVLKVEKSLRRAAHQQGESGDSAVTLERFCEVVGIEVNKRDKHRVELGDHDRNLDGGVFAESVKSLHGNNNVATTFYSGGSSDAHSVTGERKRRAPSASRGTASDPSSFWQLADTNYTSNGLSQLFPSPMPTFRSPNVRDTARGALVMDSAAATRGVVRLQPTVGLAQLLNNIQHDANLQGTEEESRGRAHFTGQSNQQSTRRAQSAPARSRTLLGRTTTMPRNNTSAGVSAVLRGHTGDTNEGSDGGGGRGNNTSNHSGAHGGFTGTDTYRASAHQHHQASDNQSLGNSTSHTNTTSNTNNTTSTSGSAFQHASMAEKIARWAPKVSDYYQSKERLSLGGTSAVQDDGAPQRSRSSLRRQFLTANQSYMQGASAAGVVTKSVSAGSSVSASNNAPFATYASFE